MKYLTYIKINLLLIIFAISIGKVAAQQPVDTDGGATPIIESLLNNYNTLSTMVFHYFSNRI